MLSRALAAHERPLVRALQTTRTLLFVLVTTVVAAILIQADPDHHLANALMTAAYNWAHVALPTLVK